MTELTNQKKSSIYTTENNSFISSTSSKENSKMGIHKNENKDINYESKQNNPVIKSRHVTILPKRMSLNKNFKEDLKEDVTNTEENDRIRRLSKREKICVTDSEDEGSDREKNNPLIITPENSFKRFWDISISLIILYTSMLLPYKIAFTDDDSASPLDTFFDIVLFIDMILSFFSAYIDNEENIIKNHKKIVIAYLKSWFIIDSVSIIPISYFTESKGTLSRFNSLTKIGKIPRLYRLLRLAKLMRMLKMAKRSNHSKFTKFFLEKLKVNSNIERLIYFILGFLLLNHMSACVWYFVAKLQDLDPDCWVVRLGFVDASNYEIYIISFYWTLTTVTTVGYGDVSAGTTTERIYGLFIMSCGVLMYSFAIGALSSIVASFDAKNREMNTKLSILASIKKEFSLNEDIYDKVRKVIKYDSSKNQKDKMNFLAELPNKLRIELSQEMHDKVIQDLYFFKDQPRDFIAYVAPLLKPVKFAQNDYLYKTGDNLDEMYFVTKGTVIFCLDKIHNEKEIKEIKKNNSFGEIEMCLNKQLAYNIKVKSRVCELFVLKKDDFLRLSVNFKEFIEKFLKKSLYKFLKLIEDLNEIINNLNNGNDEDEISNKPLEIIEEGSENDSGKETHHNHNEEGTEISPKVSKTEREKSPKVHNEENNESEEDLDDDDDSDSEKEKVNGNNKEEDSNKKFITKITRILECLDKANLKFNSKDEENPRILLNKLKNETDPKEKNKFIDKIENLLTNALKNLNPENLPKEK